MKKEFITICVGVLLTLFFVISCSTSDNKANVNSCDYQKEEFTLIKGKEVSFKLDSITAPSTRYLKFHEVNDTLFLTFLNTYNSSLYCYDYNNKSLSKTIKLSNLGADFSGYEIINWDSIVTYRYKSNRLMLQNGLSDILKQIAIPPNEIYNGYSAMPSSHLPIIYDGKDIYIAGAQISTEKANEISKPIVKVNRLFDYKEYLYKFPQIYHDMFFGGANYRVGISYVYNPNNKNFVISFPASHKIYTTENFKDEKEYCAGSKYIETIPRYSTGKGTMNPEEVFKFSTENGIYQGILYDKYKDLYYRLCLLPSKWQGVNNYSRDLSIIIMGNNFNIVGEKLFKNDIDFHLENLSTISVSPDGILIQKKRDYSNEDSLDFFTYKIVKI